MPCPDGLEDFLGNNADFLREVITKMPGYVYWKDRQSVYRGCNANLSQLLGLASPHEIIGKTDHDFYWENEQANKFIQDDQEVMDQKITTISEHKIPISSTLYGYYRTEKSPLYVNNNIVGVLAIAIDITKEKEATLFREKLKLAREQLNVLETLSGSLAHELQTPLTAIQMACDGLLRSFPTLLDAYERTVKGKAITTPLSEPQLNYLRKWESLCTSILDSSRITFKMFLMNLRQHKINQDHFASSSINEHVHQAIDDYPFFNDAQRDLVHIDHQQHFTYHGDPQLTQHILWNLVKNALYYIRSEHKGKIYIYFKQNSTANELHFKDTACGISPEVAEKMFERFYSTRQTGTGLGLALCKLIMKAYEGSIRCEAQKDDYTHFILSFPPLK